MALEKMFSKSYRDPQGDLESNVRGVRQQLSEQLKCLDQRLDAHVTLVGDLQDFYKRRAEVELDYARAIDKLVKQITARQKATDKQKRETMPAYCASNVWQTLLAATRKQGRDHGILGELYSNHVTCQLNDLVDDLQRVYKRCHEMALGGHEELMKVLTELHSSMKTYQQYHTECLQAENKMRHADSQRAKVDRQASSGGVTAAKTAISRRFRNYEKESEKKHIKYVESGLKAVKARNEYILCIEAANAALQKYFADDIHEIINLMDYGYHESLCRVLLTHSSAEASVLSSRRDQLDVLNRQIQAIDQRVDKQLFLEMNQPPFCVPRTFEFQAHRGDEVQELCAQNSIQDELYDRLNVINDRLNSLKLDSDEIWKTLESTESRINKMSAALQKDCDVTSLFLDDAGSSPQQPKHTLNERERSRTECIETESFYLGKYKDFHTVTNLIVRLQSKYNCIEKALTQANCVALQTNRPQSIPMKPKRRKTPGDKIANTCQPKLFGGTIQEYVSATGEDIPLIIRSCVRMINLYGMHHQGVFRIPGSQHEINEFRNEFERGKDPLPETFDGKDMNSVAGVLKLYFRELREPLFPTYMFDDLISCSTNCNFNKAEDVSASVNQIKALLSTLPRSILIVMRYIFAFLNHLSEFSDENLMDTYNLAVCFGPTLIRVPSDRDPVHYNPHVTELVRNMIIYHEDVFSNDDLPSYGPTCYEKCLVDDDGREDSIENLYDEDETGVDPNSDDDGREAVATYDFQGRSEKELSFRQGDVLLLHDRVSADWWHGSTLTNQRGLIPDKYITFRHKDKSDTSSCVGRHAEESKWKSTESLPLAKSFRLSVNPVDDDDLSASHPNVCLVTRRRSATKSPTPPVVSQSFDSSSHHVSKEIDRPMSAVVVKLEQNSGADGGGSVGSGRRTSVEELSAGLTVVELPKRAQSTERSHVVVSKSPLVSRERRRLSEQSSSSTSTSSADRKSFTGDSVGAPPVGPKPVVTPVVASSTEGSRLSKTSRLFDVGRPLEQEEKVEREDDYKTAEDLALDIDSALAEVMSGIESLGLGHVLAADTDVTSVDDVISRTPTSKSSGIADVKGTPDLVLGLPTVVALQPTSPKILTAGDKEQTVSSSLLTTAEVFANVNQSTIKKGAFPSVSSSESGQGHGHGYNRKTAVSKLILPKDNSKENIDINLRLTDVDVATSPTAVSAAPADRISSNPPDGAPLTPVSKPPLQKPTDPAGRKEIPIASRDEFVRSMVPSFNETGSNYLRSLSLVQDDSKLSNQADGAPLTPPASNTRPSTVFSGLATLPRTLPSHEQRLSSTASVDPTETAAKPPVKVKPPVMKKPAKTGEMMKQLQKSLGQQGCGSNTGCSQNVGINVVNTSCQP